tara:strand:+ start:102 stop:245 length:144 start_codon:yes stop_codon:yes gene_type:complete
MMSSRGLIARQKSTISRRDLHARLSWVTLAFDLAFFSLSIGASPMNL